MGWGRGDAIIELDWCVGELLDTLDELKLAENTMVVFCSDNGPVLDDGYKDQAIEMNGDHRPAGPYQGGKYNIYEGGTRTPMITRWLGTIPEGVSDQMVCTIDFAASFAKLAGAKLPSDGCLDSLDLSDAFLGKSGATGRPYLVQQDNGQAGNFGLRESRWKLMKHGSKKSRNVGLRLQARDVPTYQLFDLDADESETENVIDQHPDVAERMKQKLASVIEAGRSRPQ